MSAAPLAVAKAWIARRWRECLLIVCSVAFASLISEIGFRAYQYVALPRKLSAIIAASAPTGPATGDQFLFDEQTGYRYTPNFVGERGAPWYSHWRTNRHGHVSRFDYTVEKPIGEYRIAVVGDSMTANITNNVRWTEVLEEELNGSSGWTGSVGGRVTRVINFGVDGMGMVQLCAMVRHHVMKFEPDLIIVSMISDDILRRLRYLNIPYRGRDRDQHARAYVERIFWDQTDWFRVYPELLAATAGRFWGMPSSLPLDARAIMARDPQSRYSSRREAIAASAAAIRDILPLSKNILFLQMPLFEELEGHPAPAWVGLVEDVQKIVPGFEVVPMLGRMDALLQGKRYKDRPDLSGMTLMQIMGLPEAQRLEIYRWFFLPQDTHYTDYGTTLYAREVAKLLIGRTG